MSSARKRREAYQGCVHVAFTACVQERKPVLVCEDEVTPIIEALKRACDEAGCFVPMYCVMPDHVHIMFTGHSPESDAWLAMVKFKSIHGSIFTVVVPPGAGSMASTITSSAVLATGGSMRGTSR